MGFWSNIFKGHNNALYLFESYVSKDSNILFEFPYEAKLTNGTTVSDRRVKLFINNERNLVLKWNKFVMVDGQGLDKEFSQEIEQKYFITAFNITHTCQYSCSVSLGQDLLIFNQHEDVGMILSAFGFYNRKAESK